MNFFHVFSCCTADWLVRSKCTKHVVMWGTRASHHSRVSTDTVPYMVVGCMVIVVYLGHFSMFVVMSMIIDNVVLACSKT